MTCLNNLLVLSKETCQVTSKPSHYTIQITHTSLNTPLLLKVCKCCAGTMRKKCFMTAKFNKTKKCKPVVTTDAVLNQHYNSKGRDVFQYPRGENLCNQEHCSKASSVPFTCRQWWQEHTLLFLVQRPIPHVSITLFQWKVSLLKRNQLRTVVPSFTWGRISIIVSKLGKYFT